MKDLCDKCKYPCFTKCPAYSTDVEYGGEGTAKDTIVQCDKFENANLNEPRGVWAMDKNIEDFKQIAYNLRREGHVSRADAIMYLIERLKIAEGRYSKEEVEARLVAFDCGEDLKEDTLRIGMRIKKESVRNAKDSRFFILGNNYMIIKGE